MQHARQTERINLRTTPETKRLLMDAAAAEEMDLTTFVVRSARQRARRVMARRETRTLSASDALLVADMLEQPAPPTPALREAARRYRERRLE